MSKSNIKVLENFLSKLEKLKNEQLEAEAEQKVLMRQLQEEFDCKSVKEAEKYMKELDKELEELEEKADKEFEKLEEELEEKGII